MGFILDLSIDEPVQSYEPEHIGYNSFYSEIVSGGYYFCTERILNKEELDLLFPYSSDLEEKRLIDPKKMKTVFVKILNDLKNRQYYYPFVHWISTRKEEKSGASGHFLYYSKLIKCHLDGYHFNPFRQQELELSVIIGKKWEFLTWIKAKPVIRVCGKKLYIKTETKYEQFKDLLEEYIYICDLAIQKNKKVTWTIHH